MRNKMLRKYDYCSVNYLVNFEINWALPTFFPANTYFFKVTIYTLEKGVKYVQSYQ